VSNNGNGGGIDVAGGATLNLFDSTVSGNLAADNAGGLRVEGTATAERDTFSGNMATGGFAGGIGVTSGSEEFAATGRLTLKNSTVTGNSASLNGGGLGGFGNVTVVGSTIASNTAPTGSNLVAEGGTTTLQNTIVADPMVTPMPSALLVSGGDTNCASTGGTLTSNGFNLEDDAAKSCGFTQSTDPPASDPKLGPLADNGGPTKTLALTAGSPAIDTGTAEGLTVNRAGRVSDQRGVIRPVGVQADIGAFELAPPTAVTGAASDVTPTGATVAGTATNPDVTGGQAFFEYGVASDPTGSQTTTQPVAAGASGAPLSAQLTGLTPSTTYHYRLVVKNADGTSTGEDRTFTTPAPPDTTLPTVTIVTPADGAFYRQGDVINASYSCADQGGSGLKSCVGPVANGSPIDTANTDVPAKGSTRRITASSVGGHSFTVTAADNAGNTATKTVHYTVIAKAAPSAPPAADLALSARARPDRVRVGDRFAYTLTLTNHGPDRATSVVVRAQLPGQVRFLSARVSRGGSCTGRGTVVCRFSSLRPGDQVRVVITVQAVRTGHTRSAARVSGAQSDPRRSNNVAVAGAAIIPRPRPRFTG